MTDLIIIGAGPSGMTGALYALRAGKSVLLFEKEGIGGQVALSPRLENFPSIKAISGTEFADNLFNQITDLGAELEFGDVSNITKEGDIFKVTADGNVFEAKAVVIATGVKHRSIGVAREEELIGSGVSYCAVCDGPFFKGEDVVVIGDANTALQYAILLSNYCNSVHIATLFDKFFAENILVDRVKSNPKITYTHNLSLKAFNGEKSLEGLTFENTKTKEEVNIPCKGAFICIGQIPNNDAFASLVDLEKGFIKTNSNQETKTPGLFAAGDCCFKAVKQVATAVSDGAIAATMACRYIDSLK